MNVIWQSSRMPCGRNHECYVAEFMNCMSIYKCCFSEGFIAMTIPTGFDSVTYGSQSQSANQCTNGDYICDTVHECYVAVHECYVAEFMNAMWQKSRMLCSKDHECYVAEFMNVMWQSS